MLLDKYWLGAFLGHYRACRDELTSVDRFWIPLLWTFPSELRTLLQARYQSGMRRLDFSKHTSRAGRVGRSVGEGLSHWVRST